MGAAIRVYYGETVAMLPSYRKLPGIRAISKFIDCNRWL